MNQRTKILILLLTGCLLLGGIALAPVQLGGLGRLDLFPYWASAHLLIEGTNPYDYDAIVALMAKVVPDRACH